MSSLLSYFSPSFFRFYIPAFLPPIRPFSPTKPAKQELFIPSRIQKPTGWNFSRNTQTNLNETVHVFFSAIPDIYLKVDYDSSQIIILLTSLVTIYTELLAVSKINNSSFLSFTEQRSTITDVTTVFSRQAVHTVAPSGDD